MFESNVSVKEVDGGYVVTENGKVSVETSVAGVVKRVQDALTKNDMQETTQDTKKFLTEG